MDGSASGIDSPEENRRESSLELSGLALAAAVLASALAPRRLEVFGAMLPQVCRSALSRDPASLEATENKDRCMAAQGQAGRTSLGPFCMVMNTGSRE